EGSDPRPVVRLCGRSEQIGTMPSALSGTIGRSAGSALGELEALARALAAVLLAFLHAAIAGQEVRIAQLLGHAADLIGAIRALLLRGGQPEHLLEGTGDPLANGPGLPADAAALDLDKQVEPATQLGDFERPGD